MPMYDLTCPNGHEQLDKLLKLGERPPCPECGEPTSTLWRGSGASVIDDSIPGGYKVYHGICEDDGSPKTYYSKSDMVKAAKEKGLMNTVRHKPDPRSGSDKSKLTQRWI